MERYQRKVYNAQKSGINVFPVESGKPREQIFFTGEAQRRSKNIGVGERGLGAGGLHPLLRWKNVQKLATIGQKIGLRSGKIFVNNRFFIRQLPKL